MALAVTSPPTRPSKADLRLLYERRSVLERLIRSLERYQKLGRESSNSESRKIALLH